MGFAPLECSGPVERRSVLDRADPHVLGLVPLGHGAARVVADAVLDAESGKDNVSHVEGYENGRWILIDYFCVVIHIFLPDVRDFYGLERLWGDAPKEEFPDGV